MDDVAGLVPASLSLCTARDPDLFEGALLVSELVDAGDDPDGARGAVAGFADSIRDRTAAGRAGVAALRPVLFEEEGFGGDEDSYDEPSNSSVVRVLHRRRACRSRSRSLTIEVGRLAGLRLTGHRPARTLRRGRPRPARGHRISTPSTAARCTRAEVSAPARGDLRVAGRALARCAAARFDAARSCPGSS